MSKIQIHSFDVSLEFWIFFLKKLYIYIHTHSIYKWYSTLILGLDGLFFQVIGQTPCWRGPFEGTLLKIIMDHSMPQLSWNHLGGYHPWTQVNPFPPPLPWCSQSSQARHRLCWAIPLCGYEPGEYWDLPCIYRANISQIELNQHEFPHWDLLPITICGVLQSRVGFTLRH